MKKVLLITVICLITISIGILCYIKFFKGEKEVIEEVNDTEVVDSIKIIIEDKELVVKLENNSTTKALIEKLNDNNLTIEAKEYGGFEKVGQLGFKLPRRDKYTQTKVGDVMLYNGDEITIFYDTNTWNYTKIGSIDISKEELMEILGDGDIIYTIAK